MEVSFLFTAMLPRAWQLARPRHIKIAKGIPTTSYLASYYDVDRKKVGESSEQIADLFHVAQESERDMWIH